MAIVENTRPRASPKCPACSRWGGDFGARLCVPASCADQGQPRGMPLGQPCHRWLRRAHRSRV